MNSEELLKQAVIRFHEAELKSLPENEFLEKELEVSPEFESRMEQMIRKSRRQAVRNKIARRAAGFFIGITASIVFLCAVNENIRARCLQFLREVMDGMTEYISTVQTDDPAEKDIIGFQPGYVPVGFRLTDQDFDTGTASYQLADKEVYLDFNYDKSEDLTLRVNTEHSSLKKVTLSDGTECDFYEGKDKQYLLVWQIKQYTCWLSLTGDFTGAAEEELIKTVENIQIVRGNL